jgi:6-phosphogluconolactonase
MTRRSLLSALAASAAFAAPPAAYWIYVGANTRRNARGIYVSRLDAVTGAMSAPKLAAETANPLFLTVHPIGRTLYATGELPGTDGVQGCVNAYGIDPATGALTFVNRIATQGGLPIYLTTDQKGGTLLAANYRSGSVVAMPLSPEGRPGEISSFSQHFGSSVHPQRQTGPHAHCVEISPDGRYLLAPDLGIDRVVIYRLDTTAHKLALNDPSFIDAKPGAGPRHITFHPKKPIAYLINELDSGIHTFAWNRSRGALTPIAGTSALPPGFTGRSVTAEIRVHSNGKFLYASNRGHNSIAVFAIERDGSPRLIEHTPSGGAIPNSFTLDPQGRWLISVNQNSDSVNAFAIGRDGRLTAGASIAVDTPAAVRLAPAI